MKSKFLVAIFAIALMCISCNGNGNDPSKGSSTPELIEQFLGKTTNEADKIITNAGWELYEEEEDYRLYLRTDEIDKMNKDEEFLVTTSLEVDVLDGIFVGTYYYSYFEEMSELRKQTREVVNWAYSNVLKGKSITDSYVTIFYEESALEDLKHDDFVKKLSAEDWLGAIEGYNFEGGGYSVQGVEARKKQVEPTPPLPEPRPNGIGKQLDNENADIEISRDFIYHRSLISLDYFF